MTDPTRFQIIKGLFQEAAELPRSERATFLRRVCGDDAELRREVEQLLEEHDTATAAGSDPRAETSDTPGRGAHPTPAPPREEVPTHIGPYEIKHELGRGGMGIVYRAVRHGDKFTQLVALKVVKRGLDTDEVLHRFELERQVLAAMNHPGIARLYDGGATEDGRPYFAMEYIDGEPIDEYCDSHRLTIAERIGLFRKVCEAVHYAHKNLIVHRDLKPGNIIVTEDGQPKLLDFGIAKLINPALSLLAEDYTAPDRRVMTARYASPEQARGAPIGTASDVYSLGVVLFELLTGHAPYRLMSRMRKEMERVICEVDPERPSTAISRTETIVMDGSGSGSDSGTVRTITPESVSRVREGRPERLRRRLAGDIDNIVLMALRKEPQRRYESAVQFSEDLQRHLDGRPVIARPDTFGYRTGKFLRRNRVSVSVAAVIAMLLIGGIGATTWQWQRAKAAEEREKGAVAWAGHFSRGLLVDIYDKIRKLEGSLPARQMLIDNALEYLQGLVERSPNNLELMKEVAAAYEKLGDLQGGSRAGNLGKTEQAVETYRKAVALRETLADALPGDSDNLAQLGVAYTRLAEPLAKTGSTAEALDMRRKAMTAIKGALAIDPSNVQYRHVHSVTLLEMGDALDDIGDTVGAIPYYDESRAIREALAAEHPEDARIRRSLTVFYNRLGGTLSARGEFDAALEYYQAGLEGRLRLAKEDPDNSRAQRDVALSHYFIGCLFALMQQPEEALQHGLAALAIAETRANANPKDEDAQSMLTYVLHAVGGAQLELGETEAGLATYRRSRTVISPWHEKDKKNVDVVSYLAASNTGIGDALALLGRLDEAISTTRNALTLLEPLVTADPGDVWARRDLADVQTRLGAILTEADQPEEADRLLKAAEANYTELNAADTDDVELRMQFEKLTEARARWNEG